MRFFLSGGAGGSGGAGSGSSGRESNVPAEPSPGALPEPSLAPRPGDRRGLEVINPLNTIVGFSSMLADPNSELTPEIRQRYAARVRDAAGALRRMMSALGHSLEAKGLDLSEDWVSSGTFRVAPEAAREESSILSARPSPEVDGKLDAGPRPRVFIVDADESNRELLAEFLADRPYEVVLLGSGDDALCEAELRPPDLVLIDPLTGADGFHLARALKASNPRGFVPLVFVTSLVDDDLRMRALDAGAEQMVKKPVNRHELRARVKNLIDLRSHQEELAVQNAQLKSLQRFKDETTAMLVHDLKSPLSAMMMNLDFALDELPAEAPTANIRSALGDSRAAGAKLFRIIANLLDVARSDDGRLVPKREPVDVLSLFGRVVANHVADAKARKVTLRADVSLTAPIEADQDLLMRVLANLVENALRYTYAEGTVVLAARSGPGSRVELTVTNDGRPLSPELRALVFEKYPNVAPSEVVNRGLGLYFCRVAIEAHGGSIELVSEPSSLTCFRILLPQR